MYFKFGDSLHWALPDYDDSHWQTKYAEPETPQDYLWVRVHVNDENLGKIPDIEPGISVGIFTPAELYWNGVLIGSNTIKNLPIESDSARLFTTLPIPNPAPPGEPNLLVIRLLIRNYMPNIMMGEIGVYQTLLKEQRIQEINELILGVIYFVIAAFYLFFWASGETQYASKVFIFLLLLASITSINDFLLHYINPSLEWIIPFYAFDVSVMFGIGMLIPLFLMQQFNYPKKWHLIPFGLIVLFLVYMEPGGISMIAGIIFSFGISIWALVKKRDDSIPLFIGMLACFVGGILNIIWDYNLLDAGFLTLIIITNIVLMLRIRQRRQDHQSSLTRSARLEAQLLRKSIQPHYVLNSMNAVMDWIETEPEKGIEFLGALAEEFQVLSRISHKKEIPVAEEIRICEAHLKIMSCRKEIDYALKTKGILPEEHIPPAIFHTLIENGVKYGSQNGKGVDFLIEREDINSGRRYRIFNTCPEQ
ncbi:MAG: histidine kinase, partial [Calditrichota bacterium]